MNEQRNRPDSRRASVPQGKKGAFSASKKDKNSAQHTQIIPLDQIKQTKPHIRPPSDETTVFDRPIPKTSDTQKPQNPRKGKERKPTARPASRPTASATSKKPTQSAIAADKSRAVKPKKKKAHRFRISVKPQRHISFYLICIGATAALYFTLLAIVTFSRLPTLLPGSLSGQGTVKVTVGEENSAFYESARISKDKIYQNGVTYLNMNQIASLCELTTTGDLTRMRYTSREGNGQSVIFFVESKTAVINGTPVLLSGKTLLYGDTVYVSSDFFRRFVNGVEVEKNEEKNTITIKRQPIAQSVMNGIIYADVSFTVGAGESSESIDWDLLDLDTQMKIEASSGIYNESNA